MDIWKVIVMFDNIDRVSIISASRGISRKNPYIITRKNHSFIYRQCGCAEFLFEGKKIVTRKYDVIFLPKGSSYNFSVLENEECRYSGIIFDADIPDAFPQKFSLENFADAEYIFSRLPVLWNYGNQSEKYKCLSMMYNLLAYLSSVENLEYSQKKKFHIIDPAVSYLRDHIFDSSLRADSLHLLCGISDTYFRRIFHSRFSSSPQDYIISKRISHAKAIIDSGNYDTISDVASSVGYDDPLYFSRVFKKKYGVSPSDIKNEAKQ